MNYFLFKLQFDTAVHFGGADSALSLYTSEETLRADTLFSALCHETLVQHGEEALEQLCAQVRQGKFLLSDTMPWYGETFYLPKPIAASESTEEVETTLRKKVKKLAWIPVLAFDRYARSLHEGHFTPDEQPESFGTHYEQTKAAVPMQGDTMPYQVGLFRFAPDCGLYFICGFTEDGQDEDLEYLLDWLGATGIGGKVSSGYGKFHIVDKIYLNEPFDEQTEWMYHALSAEHAPYLLLSTSLPQTDELDNALEGASFQLVRRSGFMASDRVETPLKKKTQYALSAGSVLQNRYQRAFSWFDSYDIYDENENTMYVVKGQFSWGHCLKIYDAKEEQELGTVKQEVLTWLPKFELYEGETCIGTLKKELSWFKPKYNIDFNGWHVEGDFAEWDYTITGPDGGTVATVSKELFHWTDTYILDIADPADALYVLMFVLAIDAEKCSRN